MVDAVEKNTAGRPTAPSGGVDALVAGLAAAGVELVTPVTEAPGGRSTELNDPDGHIWLYQDRALPR